ncbi:ABC-F family ATP-binding cassette domain-containing protein [Chitinimonas sp. BJB300]|nr:ABC-F family ATP-binding cassette domain-containing protein [Chitinimonas sp. BJB300]PHV12429.1 ABC transporter ATP-binding protein [Chitinimonas sp. BJB300]TSJ89015.1 ABC-F family ATP-binding cassette domain-containing protein [Chitinimonas sp. BJB300]
MPMIQLQGLGLVFPHKTCFSGFSTAIEWGQRIAIVGANGNGKSSLLKILVGSLAPSEGTVCKTPGLGIGYVAQVLDSTNTLSGGQRVNQALSQALAQASDLLLLDEPTNHLDADNRRSLSRMLQGFYGSIMLVTHDEALMDQVCDSIWHIGEGRIDVFSGRYTDYLAEQALQRDALGKQLAALKRAQQDTHDALMQEQERASHARQRGAKSIRERKWPTVKSPTKLGRGSTTAGNKQVEIKAQQRDLMGQLEQLRPIGIIVPRFHLSAAAKSRQGVLQITNGAVGYDRPILQPIHMRLAHGEPLALQGRNGSGKSTLARAIQGDPGLIRSGTWITPPTSDIGYLDQHYANLAPNHTVLQALMNVVPDWPMQTLRRHLSDFLFRQDEAVQNQVCTLSGGEKARLSLACIAAKTPQLLILDELTNNLDTTMRRHMIEILRNYPGALLVISHDEDFLQQIGVTQCYPLPSRPPDDLSIPATWPAASDWTDIATRE